MDDFRSRSCGDGRKQMEFYSTNPQPPQPTIDFRCYSTSSYPSAPRQQQDRDVKFNKVKSTNGPSSSSASTSVSKSWSFSDPELQRKKRVASYKVYIVEGKMKGSLRKSFRWIKDRCSQAVYGWR
ncbi:unnamed protein product [Rhodiola kirilowii]